MTFERARRIADAVLYEGYVLYPYRASAAKNRVRWQFGVVTPRGYAEAGGSEPSAVQTECLVEGETPVLDVRVRFLQVQSRTVETCVDPGVPDPVFRPVETMEVEGKELVTWDEGIERSRDLPAIPLRDLVGGGTRTFPLDVPWAREIEPVRDSSGVLRGQIVRERSSLAASVSVSAEETTGVVKVRVRVENRAAWSTGAPPDRNAALRRSLVGVHTFLAVKGGAFVSLLDPPPLLAEAAASCRNESLWPVLVGDEGARDVMLSSPIILYDYPAVAPESPGDLCDATEIDEILLLRVMTLSEDEKREARATDERARRIVDRSDSLPPEVFERLHGAIRSLRPAASPSGAADPTWETFLNPPGAPAPQDAELPIGSSRVSRGSRVRLAPRRRADAMDLFLTGRSARVEGVFRDVEDKAYVAVTIDDDPAGELQGAAGRYFYFYPEEIEPQ